MKNFNLIKRLWTDSHEKQSPQRFGRYAAMLIMLLTLGTGQMWANGGIGYKGVKFTKNGSATGWYNIHNVSWDYSNASYECRSGQTGVTDFNNASLGTVTTLKLKAFVVIGWTDNSDYVAGQLKYRLYKQGASAPSYSTYNVGNYGSSSNSSSAANVLVSSDNNRVVGNASLTTDIVTSSTPAGNYYLQLQGLGRMQWSNGSSHGDFNANNGSEVKATLLVPGFTTTSTSNDYGSVNVGSNSSTTISFTQHYGTALTTSNCSLTNSTDFEVTAISETEVTVKFKPQASGDKSCTLTITDANSKTCTITLTGTGTTPPGLTVVAGTGISAVTGSDNDISAGDNIAITATVATGYTWDRWTLSGSGTLSTFTATTKNQTVTVGTAGTMTLTASATENMSSLSTSCSYDAGNPSYAIPTKSVSSIGIATTANLTATAPGTGYTFAGWTLSSNLVVTSGNAATDRTITVRTNGNGAAATAVANYEEDLSSPYTLKGGTNVTGDDWATAHNFTKKTGHSTESVAYCTFNISSTNAGISGEASAWSFKVINGSTWYGLTADGDSWWYQRNSGQQNLSSSGKNIQLCADVAGPYEIKVDYSGSPIKVTVTFPTSYTLTYSIGSVAGNNGSISTSPTTASGSKVLSGSTVTLTGPAAKTGYTWKGWYTNAAGTEGKITDVSRAITVTMNADKTLYACYTENTFNVSASATPAGYGTVTPTSSTSMGQITGGNITASPNAGYSFSGWSIASGSGYFGASGTATTSETANTKFRPTANATLTGTFAEVLRTVTVAVNNSYLGSVSTASLTSVGPVTKSAEVTATAETGASFTNWTLPSGVTAADGYSATSNPIKVNATADSKTITANFTETTYTVSMSTEDGDKGTVDAASASVGQITAVAISATPKSGYMFSKWVKTAGAGTVTYYTGPGNGQVTDASGEEKETTYICVTGNVTLQATWEPDRSSGYVVHYGNSGKNADGGDDASQTRPWKDGKLYRATTEASDVSYFTFTAGVGDVDKVIYFKIWDLGSNWYGYNSASGGKFSSDITNVTLNTSYGDARMCIIMPGTYTFTWNKSTKKLSVAYPTDVYYVRGGFNSWDWSHPMTETSSGVYSATVNMTEANHTYSGDYGFKLLIAGKYYGKNSTTVTRSTSTGSAAIGSCSTSGANIGITTDYTGNYTFTYTVASNTLQVTYPTAYKITFGKGSVDGTTGSFSAVDLDNGSSAVTSNSTWVKSGDDVKITAPDAKSGYRFLGWYNNNSATGDAITTNANCTISVTSATIVYACYAENLTSITVSAGTGGTVTTGSGTSNLGVTTTKAINASANPGYTWSTWTISGTAALGTTATTASNTAKGDGTNGSTGTITATFTPNPYTITLKKHNGQSDGSINVTFDANTNLTGTAVTAPTKTGYTFGGFYTGESGAGTKIINADGTVVASASDASYTYTDASKNWKYPNNITLHAKWTAKTYTVTLDYDETNHGDITTTTPTGSVTATYDAEMPSISILPKAAEGYAFMGYFSSAGGGGTQYYDGTGASVTNWNVDDEITLYAYYKQAEIASVTFDNDVVEPGATVTVTANLDPVPDGTTTICWRFLHDNGNEYTPQPTFTPASGRSVSFTAPETSTHYKVEAKLRTGSSCDGGTLLDTKVGRFQVAGSHTVTVNYKCGDDVIKAATSVTANPIDWSEEITAPDIFGYTFSSWTAADGVTIKNGALDPVTSSTNATIQIKATYNGSLTANYTQKQMIYFKNTLEWSNVYVNFYTDSYWNNPKGSGNNGVTNQNLAMTQYGETDIWYYDYGAASITPGLYVSFTSESQSNAENFWKAGGVNVVYPANYQDDIHTNKSSETGFKAATPMFVPLATQEKVTLNQSSGGKADYYNDGYWTTYTPGTGYRLEIYNSTGSSMLKYADFESADDLMPMKAVVDLEGGQTYKFQIRRGGESSAGVYYGNSGTMTYTNHGQDTPWAMTNSSFTMAGITANAPGNYTFNLSYSPNSTNQYRLRIAVDYPLKAGDYRLVYSDDVQTKPLTSAIVNKVDNGTDIVSFFVRPGSTPVLRIQQASIDGSTVTWNEYPTSGTPTNQIKGDIATALTSGGTDVYNFNLSMNGSGALSVASVEKYDGKYYIRTDAANSKWDNYRTDPDHLMTYSEYSITHGGYTHYYTHWVDKDVTGRKNVKFVVANDYSPNISDTLAREDASGTWANIDDFMTTGGDLKRSANVRFMWDKRTNTISRAYVDGAQGDYSSNFLYMLNVEDGADKIKTDGGSALTDHKITFKDNGNWMYEANIKAQPTAQIKLLSNWGTENTITQYFRGASDATETLLGGSGSTWYDIRVIYDFKTNRLIAGLIPSGTIDEQMAIHADVMFVRDHQGDIAQLTFAEKDDKMGAITDIETAYGVLQFNKWTINNKSREGGHSPLTGEDALSRYERDLFYVSFPFKVSMEEVFGFGTYGQHWIIEEYDGASRAANGYWQESGPNWKFITNRKGKFFEPGIGYIIALDLDELGESSSVWANTDQVELYFPSYGTMDNITSSTATYEIPEHECTIDRSKEVHFGAELGPEYDRRVKDSHWNVLGVPTYVNPLAPNYANTDWITEATETSIGPNFLYEWNMDDNSVSAVSASGYTYHAMHAYLVQYCGDVTWTSSVSVKPSSIVAREQTAPKNVEFKVELMQNEKAVDQTFVKLSDNENVTTGFEFNYDMSKEFNNNKANIYTMITSNIDGDLSITEAAGNVLPMSEQTTVVPVGVKIVANGDYTFSIPDGTEGTGVTLIDNETGVHTNLALMDYTVALEAGTYDGRFILEISPIAQTPTGVDTISDEGLEMKAARKVIIDEKMYILKDGKVYDARGARVQ